MEQPIILAGVKTPVDATKLALIFKSHGVKNSAPFPTAHCYVECRGVPDASNAMEGGGALFTHQQFVKEKLGAYRIGEYVSLVKQGIDKLPERRKGEDMYGKPFIICCLCAHGIHRSVAMKHILAAEFHKLGFTHITIE